MSDDLNQKTELCYEVAGGPHWLSDYKGHFQ